MSLKLSHKIHKFSFIEIIWIMCWVSINAIQEEWSIQVFGSTDIMFFGIRASLK